jgi:dGTPase
MPTWEPDDQSGLEAQVVNAADEIAYNAHDLDDGLRSGHLDVRAVAEVPLIGALFGTLEIDPRRFGATAPVTLVRELLGLIIEDVIAHTATRLDARRRSARSTTCARRTARSWPERGRLAAELGELKRFLYENFYFHYRQIRMTRKADHILERLYLRLRGDSRRCCRPTSRRRPRSSGWSAPCSTTWRA